MLRTSSFDEVTRFDCARTLLGRGRYWTSAYLIDGLLVDTGCAHTAREFDQALSGTPVVHILSTHSHEDHIGANGLLQRTNPQVLLSAHPLALPILADPQRTQRLHPYRQLFWGMPDPCHAQPVADGAVIETAHYAFRVIYTPGHSPDHLCLYEPMQGWLFTGDLFVGGQDRSLRAGYDIVQIIASLKRIAELPSSRLFPASARVRDKPQEVLAAKISYLEELGEKIRELKQQGRTVKEIVRSLCGASMPIEWITLGNVTREHLVRSYLSD